MKTVIATKSESSLKCLKMKGCEKNGWDNELKEVVVTNFERGPFPVERFGKGVWCGLYCLLAAE